MSDFRCSLSSAADEEPIAGTAPEDTTWLLVEYAGAWGRNAVAEARLPEPVLAHLGSLTGVRAHLVRRYGGRSGPGVRVFVASLAGPGITEARVWGGVLDDVAAVTAVDPHAPEASGLTAYDGPLLLVCTNGRRDRCCSEVGRPVAGALAARWPEATWETNHLGGHRFAGTLLALPSAVTLGRLSPDSAVAACERLLSGTVPVELSRGRAGLPAHAQYAELAVRRETGLTGVDQVEVVAVDGRRVSLRLPGGAVAVEVESTKGEPRRQSCGDLATKPVTTHRVLSRTEISAAGCP